MQKPTLIRCLTCPVCKSQRLARVQRVVDNRMRDTFPDTYGKGNLICDECHAVVLEGLRVPTVSVIQ